MDILYDVAGFEDENNYVAPHPFGSKVNWNIPLAQDKYGFRLIALNQQNVDHLLGDSEVTAQIYPENHAIFPIRIRKMTVQICGNFSVTQYICIGVQKGSERKAIENF